MTSMPFSNSLSPAPVPGIPTTIPSIATTSRTSSDSRLPSWAKRGEGLHPRTHSSASTGSPMADSVFERTESAQQLHHQEKYAKDYFSHRRVELPPSSQQLPPEIANFMNRVRNFSADGSDSQVLNSLSQQSDSPGMKRSKDSLLDSIKEGNHNNGVAGKKDGKTKKRVEFSDATLSKSMPVLDREGENGSEDSHDGPEVTLSVPLVDQDIRNTNEVQIINRQDAVVTHEQHISAEFNIDRRFPDDVKRTSAHELGSESQAAGSLHPNRHMVTIHQDEPPQQLRQQQQSLAPPKNGSSGAPLSSRSFNRKQESVEIETVKYVYHVLENMLS